jgi:hypothetical protein
MHISYTESAPTSEPAKFGPYFGCPYWNSSSDQVLHSSSFLFGLGLGLLCNWRLFIESYNVTKFTGNLTSICYLWSLNFVTINALIYNEQTRSQMSEGTKRSRNPNTNKNYYHELNCITKETLTTKTRLKWSLVAEEFILHQLITMT